jgi:hypothetical protein
MALFALESLLILYDAAMTFWLIKVNDYLLSPGLCSIVTDQILRASLPVLLQGFSQAVLP